MARLQETTFLIDSEGPGAWGSVVAQSYHGDCFHTFYSIFSICQLGNTVGAPCSVNACSVIQTAHTFRHDHWFMSGLSVSVLNDEVTVLCLTPPYSGTGHQKPARDEYCTSVCRCMYEVCARGRSKSLTMLMDWLSTHISSRPLQRGQQCGSPLQGMPKRSGREQQQDEKQLEEGGREKN